MKLNTLSGLFLLDDCFLLNELHVIWSWEDVKSCHNVPINKKSTVCIVYAYCICYATTCVFVSNVIVLENMYRQAGIQNLMYFMFSCGDRTNETKII